VQNAAVEHRIVRDDPDRIAADPRQAGDDVAGKSILDRKEVSVVNDAANDLVHVKGLAGILRNDAQQLLVAAVRGIIAAATRRPLLAVTGEEGEVLANCRQTGGVVRVLRIRGSGNLGMNLRAPPPPFGAWF